MQAHGSPWTKSVADNVRHYRHTQFDGTRYILQDQPKLDSDTIPANYSPIFSCMAGSCLFAHAHSWQDLDLAGVLYIPYLVMSEILPTPAQGTVSGISTAVFWTTNLIRCESYLFHDFNEGLYYYGTAWLYALALLWCLSFLLLHVFLPETKGRTLEEIEQCFAVADPGPSQWWKWGDKTAME